MQRDNSDAATWVSATTERYTFYRHSKAGGGHVSHPVKCFYNHFEIGLKVRSNVQASISLF